MSEFCKPEQRNDAAAVSVIDRSSPHTGTGENTEANMSTTSSQPIPAKAPAGAVVMDRVIHDLGGGARRWKVAWVINFQKLGTLPLLVSFIAWYHNTSPRSLDIPRHARQLLPSLDNQGLGLSRPQFPEA